MVDARELRIGNLLYCENKAMTVSVIEGKNIIVDYDGIGYSSEDFVINQIQLTEEWFNRFEHNRTRI